MKIATFNVNGVNGRLPVLLRWLATAKPDVVCLQELKAPHERFPELAIRKAGYDAVWHGQKSWNGVAILALGIKPIETRRGLPDDPDDSHSRYIEATIEGVLVGCLHLPNGNPAPGPTFDYKLRWFERLNSHSAALLALDRPVVLAGDYNVMPTDLDVYAPERWIDDALFRPEVRDAFHRLTAQGGRMLCEHSIRTSGSILSGNISGMPMPVTPAFASTICSSADQSLLVLWRRTWTVRYAGRRERAITLRPGSNLGIFAETADSG